MHIFSSTIEPGVPEIIFFLLYFGGSIFKRGRESVINQRK